MTEKFFAKEQQVLQGGLLLNNPKILTHFGTNLRVTCVQLACNLRATCVRLAYDLCGKCVENATN